MGALNDMETSCFLCFHVTKLHESIRFHVFLHLMLTFPHKMVNGPFFCKLLHSLLVLPHTEFMLEDMKAKTKKGKGDSKRTSTLISAPQDFRRVCAIVDADMLPDTVRRVKLLKHSSDRPLGFYIRDGTSVRVTPYGLEKVHGIFISRLVPGGLAESTGLLAVDDEILEVNGIEVLGKSLDQVTDMMVANSQNLIITVKPASLPPTTPRTVTQSMKKGKQPLNLAGNGKALGQTMTKSYGDLPSITGGSGQKGQSASLQLNRKVNSELPRKGGSWTDSYEGAVTSNGPTMETSKGQDRESDLVIKRHSISGSLDS